MTRIHLLRAVNLGARNKVPMAELRRIAEELGATGVRTLLNTGNLVAETEPEGFADALVERIRCELGVGTADVVVAPEELTAALEGLPYDDGEFATVYISVCAEAPEAGAVRALQERDFGGDRIEARGRFLYLGYRGNVHQSKLSNALVERRLGTVTTSRNVSTLRKLAALAM